MTDVTRPPPGSLDSAFIRLARHCDTNMLDSSELSALLTRHEARQSVFHFSEAASERLRTALHLGEVEWAIACGADLLKWLGGSRKVLWPHLRYCPECLSNGRHIAAFQHVGVHRCPVHDVSLADGCPNCGRRIDTSPLAIVENHLYCPGCGRLYGAVGTHGPDVLPAHERLWSAARRPMSGSLSSQFFSQTNAANIYPRSREVAQYGFHLLWAAHPAPGLRRPRTELFPVEEGDPSDPCDSDRDSGCALAALQRLTGWIKAAGIHQEQPWVLTTSTYWTWTIEHAVHLVSAAMWLTGLALGLRSTRKFAYPFQWTLPANQAARDAAIETQVYTIFALNLIHLRQYEYSYQVKWGWYVPGEMEFSPAWRIYEAQGSKQLALRSRANADLTQRLIRRYQSRMLKCARTGVP